jgi:hypothetical protein
MASLNKDISETRDTLVRHINHLTLEYSQMLHEYTNLQTNENQKILLLNNQNRLQLQEIQTLNDNISELNKKCYDYEVIINEYQKKMVEVESDREQRDRVSIMKTQADELYKKDQYIEQLQGKIKYLQGDKQNISLKFVDVDSNLEPEPEVGSERIDSVATESVPDKSGGWSPTSSNSPIQVVKQSVENDKMDTENDSVGDSDSIDIQYKRIKYKGEKYYIVVREDPQVVYEILDDDDVGDRVGIRNKKDKGKGYVINFD